MKYKICLSISGIDPEFENMFYELQKHAIVDVVGLKDFSLKGYDIFIGKKLSEATLKTADNLKIIFAYKTGVDDFPLDALKARGITLINSHIDADYIAEYALGLTISLANRITECDRKLRKGIWYDDVNPYWRSVFSMKVGLVGYGHIGKAIHKILMRNNVETYTLNRGKVYENINVVDTLEDLCKEVDLVIVSLPKTPETDKMFDRRIITLLQNKYIVNVGRSNCIDQHVLYEALRANYMAGAAIDTWDKKPKTIREILRPSEYDFEKLYNIILSPHQAMRVNDGHRRYVKDTCEKVIDYILNGNLRDVVDLNKGY